jgi:hypothetical protein
MAMATLLAARRATVPGVRSLPGAAPRLVWLCLALATLPALFSLLPLARGLPTALGARQLSEADRQRQVNGPLVAYATELAAILPAGSCLQYVEPSLIARRAAGQNEVIPNAFVLAHYLYPRTIRLVGDAAEGLSGATCGPRERYVLVWIEPGYPTAAAARAPELAALRAAPRASLVSTFQDDDGNTGSLFRVTDS